MRALLIGLFLILLFPANAQALDLKGCEGLDVQQCEKRATTLLKESNNEGRELLQNLCKAEPESGCTGLYIMTGMFAVLSALLLLFTSLVMWLVFRRGKDTGTPPALNHPNIKQTILQILTFTLLTGAVFVTLDTIPLVHGSGIALVTLLTGLIAWPIFLYFAFKKSGASLHEAFPFASVPLRFFGAGILAVVGTHILLSEFDNFCEIHFKLPNLMPPELLLGGPNIFILTVVLAPIAEELYFRGLVFRGLQRNHSKTVAIVASAALFSAMHANPPQLMPALVMGLLFAWVAYHTGSLRVTMFMHAVANGCAQIVKHVYIQGLSPMQGVRLYQPLWLDALGLVLTSAGIVWLHHEFRKLPPPSQVTAEDDKDKPLVSTAA